MTDNAHLSIPEGEPKRLVLDFVLTDAQARILEKEKLLDAGLQQLEQDRQILSGQQSAFVDDRQQFDRKKKNLDELIEQAKTTLASAEAKDREATQKVAGATEMFEDAQTKLKSIQLREDRIIADRADLAKREQALTDRTEVFMKSVRSGRIET